MVSGRYLVISLERESPPIYADLHGVEKTLAEEDEYIIQYLGCGAMTFVK
jgi:hypothetical protein